MCGCVYAWTWAYIGDERETSWTAPCRIPWMVLHDVTKSKLMCSCMLSVPCSKCISIHNVRQPDKERRRDGVGMRDGLADRQGGREVGRNRGEDW